MKQHINIATPMYGGGCTGFYAQSCLTIPQIGMAKAIDCSFSFIFNESLIQRARNLLVHQFMKREECTHLMFIDADIKFNAYDIFSMLEQDKDVICGLYPKKEINWWGVKRSVEQGEPMEMWKHRTGSIVVNLIDFQGEVTVPTNEPLRILAGGTGFMLIKKEVFYKLQKAKKGRKKLINSYMNDVGDLSGNTGYERIQEYFPVCIDPESERLLSEDYAFCKLVREAGMDIWAAPWVHLGHFGSYLFEGGLTPTV